jgi:transcriptional regulator with XRE-family HTH domain
MKKLKAYLKGQNIQEFADLLGVTDGAVYHWLNGDRVPRPPVARRIVALTGGAVTLADIYAPNRN